MDIFGWARLAFRPDCITLEYRDVNSREIAFPGRESQFPGLDQDSISPDYVLFAGVIGVGSLAGGDDRRPVSDAIPADAGTPSIDRDSGQ